MANIETASYGKEGFQFGDRVAESGMLTADEAVEVGTVVVRTSGKEWEPATAVTCVAGKGLGLVVAPVEAGTKVPFDVAIGGKFNRNFIKVDGTGITDEQCDVLRGQGMFVYNVNSIDK